MALLDGKMLAGSIRKQVAHNVAAFVDKYGRAPTLDVVLVGDDPASQIYVRNKGKACLKTGLTSHEHRLPADTTQASLLKLVRELNADPEVDGILVQLPVPDQIDPNAIIEAVDPLKDVDGYHPANMGALMAGREGLRPCTPLGCMKLLDESGVDLRGANAVVVGRSAVVGKPVSLMLLERHATVTTCHSRTKNLAHIVAEADVVIAAAGRANLIQGEWIKKGAVVIDVGINRVEDGKISGDVEFDSAVSRASWITPVPGGVGPMTIACLISNTVEAANRRLALVPK